jgi:PAS domain S-box-containing protein
MEARSMSQPANLDSRLGLLLRLVESITASPDLDQVLHRVVRSATSLVAGSLSTLWIIQDSRLVARARAGRRRQSTVRGHAGFELGEGLVGHAALHRRTLLVPDVLNDPRTVDRDYFAAEGLSACVAVPLVSHDRLVGVLALVARRAEDLGAAEVEMLTAFGGHAAIAIESARLYADAERRRREADTVADVARELAEHHDLDTVLARIVAGASALCGGDVTSLALRDGDGSFSVRHVIGARSEAYRRLRFTPGVGIGGRALVSRRPARAANRKMWPPLPPGYAEGIDAEGIQSAVAVPIIVGQVVDGLLFVCGRTPRAFSDADETVLVRLADHAAVAIANSRLFAAEQASRTEAQASAKNFRDLVDTLDAIVVDADAETFEVTFVNHRAEIILGYPQAAWYADPHFWTRHVHPDDRDEAVALCRTAIAEGRDHIMQYRMLAADGRVVWVQDMVRVLGGASGGRPQLRSVMVDITERKRADRGLNGEREILGLIAAGAPLPGVLDGICRLIESMSHDVLASVLLVDSGRLRHGAAPSLPPLYVDVLDDIPIGPTVGSCGAAAFRKETVITADIATDPLWTPYRHLALPHGLRACWSSPVLDGAGEVMATFALYHRAPGVPDDEELDLVARAAHLIRIAVQRDRATVDLQQSEERYRALVTNIPAVTWLADDRSGAIFVSPNAAQVTGFTAEELTARGKAGWFDRIHPDDVELVRRHYEALEFKREPFDLEYRMRHRNDAWIWVHDCAISTYERDGVVYFAGVLTDITARKQAELEVQQQRQLLTHLTRVATLGELSGALAHELNQPLTSILSNAQAALRFLAREPVDLTELRAILTDIAEDDRRAGDVIRRLRALLRKGETARQPLDVNEIVGDVLRLAHSELLAHGVTVTTQLTSGLPPVPGDRIAIQQVLLNLIVNACDAMRVDGAAQRQLTVNTALEGDDAVRVAIVDRGLGIPTDALERVFEPFFTTKEQGLGLGLMICRSIVTAHGGRLWAANNADRGATLSFTLPAQRADAAA